MNEEDRQCDDESCGRESCAGCEHAASFGGGIPMEKTLPDTHIKKLIGIVSGKGGVGKSMTTALLASLMNRRGFKTAVLDADMTGPSIPRIMGLSGKRARADSEGFYPVETEEGVKVLSSNFFLENDTDPVIWRGPMVAGAIKQFYSECHWGDVDFMFVDMPPGTGDVPLTVFQSLPVNGIIIVTTPQELVGMIVSKAVNMAKTMDVPVFGIVENMSYFICPHCGEKVALFGETRIEEIAEEQQIETCVRVPMDPVVSAACDAGAIATIEGKELEPLCKILSTLM